MMDARQGRALRADLRPPGVQGRRPLQVLGRAHGRGLGRRPGPGRRATPRSPQGAGIEIRYDTRATGLLHDGIKVVRACAIAAATSSASSGAPRRGPRLRRLRGERRDAHPLSRPRLGAREGARHPLQHRRRHRAWRSTSAPCRTATGRAATPSAGTATRRSSATSPSATASRSTATRSASWSMPSGERFVDEGADFRNYTYAKYGRVILEQPEPVRLAGLRQQGRCTCCATSTGSAR